MMRGTFVWIGVTAVLALGCTCLAGSGYMCTASIFELGVSARVAGLGGAFIALADDAAAVLYNPAGLSSLSSTQCSSFFTRPFNAYSYGALGVAERGWGSQLLVLDSDTLEERDVYGNPIGDFRYASVGFLFGWGYRVSEGVSLGLQLRGYGLASPVEGFGTAISPSVLIREGPRTYGIVWRNLLSTGTRFSDGRIEPWISDIALGLAWQFEDTLCCIDFTENLVTRGDISCVRVGIEHTGFRPMILRAGINREGSCFGFTLAWSSYQLDAAYLLHRWLPDTYLLSLTYSPSSSALERFKSAVSHLSQLFGGP